MLNSWLPDECNTTLALTHSFHHWDWLDFTAWHSTSHLRLLCPSCFLCWLIQTHSLFTFVHDFVNVIFILEVAAQQTFVWNIFPVCSLSDSLIIDDSLSSWGVNYKIRYCLLLYMCFAIIFIKTKLHSFLKQILIE